MIRIREAAVAGSFYPADPEALRATVQRLLDSVRPGPGEGAAAPPAALIVPHAGYVYSGPVAAAAYACLSPWRRDIESVLLLGPCHHVPLRGLAVSGAQAFRSPLGDVPVDLEAVDALSGAGIVVNDTAHAPEHSIEVQLPFLQCVLGSFRLLPLLVGQVEAAAVAAVIERFWLRPGRLLVLSTDLSHYHGYDEASRIDRETCAAIESLDGERISHGRACGASPLRGLLLAAARAGLRCVTLDLRNSGDTAGGRDRVVGYGAWMIVGEETCSRAA
jgi:AmmeMemoRadiSam system protein B